MFARHQLGHIFPVLLAISSLDDCFGGVAQRIETGDDYVWFHSHTYAICAASEKSIRVMKVRGL